MRTPLWFGGDARRQNERGGDDDEKLVSDSATSPRPGWYPDPGGSGWLRYFDREGWTQHTAPPAPWNPTGPYGYVWWAKPPWKGAQLGRPQSGPTALANPGRRLAARVLDALIMLPVLAAFLAIGIRLVAPRAGPMFPTVSNNSNAPQLFPGIFWIEFTVLGCLIATGVVMVAYETIMTVRYGRTLGKAWLGIRPVRTHGQALGWGRALGRASIYWAAALFLNWVGFLDDLWCTWDANQQCLHDKAADTIVINDPLSAERSGSPVGQ
jgi:uncharacterized RDD family membrane protein YckC